MAKEKDEGDQEKAPEKPARKPNGDLTRAGMEAIIRRGESVLYKGTNYSKIADLPDEADLIAGDAEAAELALEAMDQEDAQRAARRAKLERARTAVKADEKKPEHPKK